MKQNLTPIVKRSAESLAVAALRTHLISGSAAPGQRLTEAALSAKLSVSRATVRTALHRLTTEGLVHQIPYTGWEVVRLTARDAWELYTLRSSLEALAARLAATRRCDEAQASVSAALAQLERACRSAEPSVIADADFGLHTTIIRLAQHRRLLDQYQLIAQQTRLYIRSSDALISEPEVILAQHRPIAEAILAGRAAQAAKLSERHNVEEGEKLVAYLKSQETRTHDA